MDKSLGSSVVPNRATKVLSTALIVVVLAGAMGPANADFWKDAKNAVKEKLGKPKPNDADQGQSPEQAPTQSDSRTQNKAAAECAVAVAAVLIAECKFIEKKSNKVCALRALLAATGSAFACHYIQGTLLERKKQLQGHENELDAQLAYMRGVNEDVEKSNKQMRTAIEATEKRTDTLLSLQQQGQASKEDFDREREVQERDLAAVRNALKDQQAALDDAKKYKVSLKKPNPDVDAQYASMQRQLTVTEAQLKELTALRQRIG